MNILDAIVKYNHGIIGTLAVHMILFVWFNVENMSFTVINPKEKVVAVLDYFHLAGAPVSIILVVMLVINAIIGVVIFKQAQSAFKYISASRIIQLMKRLND